MDFLVVSLFLVSAVLADQQATNQTAAQRDAAMKLLSANLADMTFCHFDTDCSSLTDKPICDPMFRLCKPRNAPNFEPIGNDCTNDENCKAAYRCFNAKCHFTGPKACDNNDGCVNGLSGTVFQCKILAKSAPGKRCWAQCSNDKECYQCIGDNCRVPAAMQTNIGCCEGFCQKKLGCATA